MRQVSDETLVREVRHWMKQEGISVDLAVRATFRQRGLYNPSRFGRICRLATGDTLPHTVSNQSRAGETENKPPNWWQTGQYA